MPEWLHTLASLQILSIVDCPNLLSLPEGMQRLTTLRKLSIGRCPHLSRRCKKETGEDWLKISHIPEIFIVSDEDLSQRIKFRGRMHRLTSVQRCRMEIGED